MTLPPIPFAEIADLARPRTLEICQRWLPSGQLLGREWVALNPTRTDRSLGSFRVNVVTGAWADFARRETDKGGDAISLAAYIWRLSPVEAARTVARMVGHPFGATNPAAEKSTASQRAAG